MDGASNGYHFRVRIIPINQKGRWISYALRLEFIATNNKEGYEAMIVGLKLAKELGITGIYIYSDQSWLYTKLPGSFKKNVHDWPSTQQM